MAKQTILLGEILKSAVAKLNANFTEIYNLVANKVEKEEGKGLSSNDFTDAEKTKLAGLSAPTKHTFNAGGWGAATNGYYTMTISAAGKYPVKVMRNIDGVYTEALVQCAVNTAGTSVILTSEESFEGYVVLV